MSILNTTVSTTPVAIYASAGNSAVTTIYLCNVTALPVIINLYAVPVGGAANDSTIIYKQLQIAPEDTFILDTERLVLSDAEAVYANSDATNSVTATVSFIGI